MNPGPVALYSTHEPYVLHYSAQSQRQVIVQMLRGEIGLSASALVNATELISVADTPARRSFSSFAVGLITTHYSLNERERQDHARVTAELTAGAVEMIRQCARTVVS